MTTGQKIEYLRKKSVEEDMRGNYGAGIELSHELIALLDDSRVHQRLAAFQWELVARMLLREDRPVEAETAARKGLDAYLQYKNDVSGWDPERDCYLADFRMTLALSLAYQKRYAEAMPYAEQWERVHLKVRGTDDPFVKDVVTRHMKRMRARLAGHPIETDGHDHLSSEN